jgi:hypothetical protein
MKLNKILALIIIAALFIVAMYIIFGGEPSENGEEPQNRWLDLTNLRAHINAYSSDFTIYYKETSDPDIITGIDDPKNSVLIIIGFDTNCTTAEITAIQKFVEDGGKVIIADDSGYANQLSRLYGVEYKQYPVIANYDDNASIFIPLTITLGDDEYTVLTNEPIGLEVIEDTSIKIIGETDYSIYDRRYSALDVNHNNVIDGTDIQGPISLAVEYTDPSSSGKILFFSNTGIFTDKQWDITSVDPEYAGFQYENSEFIQALIPYLLSDVGGYIIYDESKQTEKYSRHLYIYS